MDALRGQLEAPKGSAVPPWVAHVVRWFWSLDGQRSGNGYAPNPLAWSEIDAWARVNGVRLDPWEAEALARMDGVRLRYYSQKRDADAPVSELPALTGDALDMMLGGGQ